MSVQKKPKSSVVANIVEQVEAGAQEELEKIMSDIEELQQGLGDEATPEPAVVAQGASASLPEPEPEVEAAPEVSSETAVPVEVEAPVATPVATAAVAANTEGTVEEPSSDEEEVVTADEDILKEFQQAASAGDDDGGMEEMLSDLKDDSPSGPNLIDQTLEAEAAAAVQEEPAALSPAPTQEHSQDYPGETMANTSRNDGSLTLTLAGNMTLKLKYEFDGQEVTVSFADGSLKVQLADGTEFKVPVGKQKRLRQVA